MSRTAPTSRCKRIRTQFRTKFNIRQARGISCKGRSVIAYSTIDVAMVGPVACITLNRTEANNRPNLRMAAELRDLLGELSADEHIRVVILTGNGLVFSTGRETPEDAGQLDQFQVARAIAALQVPVLAALNGDASDHGLELALAADIRLTVPGARFWFSPPSAVTFPYDGGTQRLPRLVGPGWARDMLLTGRRLTSGEALDIGLVNRVVEDGSDVRQVALQLAQQIAEGSPLGARYVKEAIMSGADMALPQALGLEADLNVILQSTSDRAEGIASFLERREPGFTGE